MADIWSEIGVDIDKDEGEWLYKVGTDVRGPMPHRMLVDKLLQGDLDLNTQVAREGTQFHPIYMVAAFAPHLENARRAQAKRQVRRTRKMVAMAALPVLAALLAIGFYLRWEYQNRLKAAAVAAAQKPATPPPAADPDLPKMGLVALVSLGTQDDVKIHKAAAPEGGEAPAKRKERPKKLQGPREQQGPAEPEEEVQTCKLTQQDIFGVLRGALGKLNVCVEDEKKRDTQGLLPPSLELQFVVKNNGKVTDFTIPDRHYRTGPLNNCMIKAFNTITFPTTTGANCPITIPIKIGK